MVSKFGEEEGERGGWYTVMRLLGYDVDQCH